MLSPAYIYLSEQHHIGLVSDRNSLLPLHRLSPQEERSQLQLQPLSYYANDFPAEKLHGMCPSNHWGLLFEYIQYFLLFYNPTPTPPSFIILKIKSISDALHWCSHCCGEGIKRTLTQSIYTASFEKCASFCGKERKLYKFMGNTGCKKYKCKLDSYSHGLFKATPLPFQIHTSHQGI